ncbi:MAG: CRISPR-associated endonuclease Cas2 [Thiohalocapsa sp. PB-PSB1]|mgnify:CR=1 FL=1|jgi:CRISPR-associated protein Cas2|nr:MAG: hypothetical protein N838_24445 [Thiohalocapsa sp. PB-PSB1]QQO56293.1 MAG: CRISPR-associated endonuclease Cas2 [Thiohalocapsa sp. PB-PSB1]HCS91983.1 CRISPR-associated endonuclease Cas2 [Chromatiaceae bacterium]
MAFYLVCFDITEDRARYRVGAALLDYGTRVQRSVFEIEVPSGAELERLREAISQELAEDDDCRFYALCKTCRRRSTDTNGERVAYLPAAVLI